MERQITTTEQPNLEGSKIGKDGTLNIKSLSPSQQQTLRRVGAMALISAGLLAPENAEAVTLIQLNDNGLNGLRGVASAWNGGAGSGVAVEKFQIDSPTVLTEASALANLRVGLSNYGKPITDPQWQTFRVLIYKDVNGVPENWLQPSYQIAVNSSMLQLTPTSIVDNNNQIFYKAQMSINQLIDQPGTYHLGIAFDATQHSGSALPGFNTNIESLNPLGHPDNSLFTSNGTWSQLQYPSTDHYVNINYGLEGQPVPEPGTITVALVGLGAIAVRKIKSSIARGLGRD